jgi:hypothetical protein
MMHFEAIAEWNLLGHPQLCFGRLPPSRLIVRKVDEI